MPIIPLGPVYHWWLIFVRDKSVLIATRCVQPKYLTTKSKALLAEPFGQLL